MNVGEAMANILKQEGVEYLFCYPTSQIIDEAAKIGIRPIVTRQERTGLHMADAYSRMHNGEKFGVFAMQHGPGTENAYGGVAQAFAESVPMLVIPQGYQRRIAGVSPNFSAVDNMRGITKMAEVLNMPSEVSNVMRRAFSQMRNGRGGPVLVEVPSDVWAQDAAVTRDYVPVTGTRYAPDPGDVARAVDLLCAAERPVIYAGQGVHYAKAWPQLRALAERLALPVATSLPGKSAFPEDHPLSLGSAGLSYPAPVKHFIREADVILGIGCSFTETVFGVPMPSERRVIHVTLDPSHLNKDLRAEVGLIGDAGLALDAILAELDRRNVAPRQQDRTAGQIRDVRETWLAEWMPKLTSDETPLSPYRVIWELMDAAKDEKVVVTNDAGRPRDQLTPFWVSREPQSFIGWGKSTQLGYGLGLAMGAKLACPDRVCINVWGDAAIGFTGTDIETAVRERIPVLSILFNNGGMATEKRNLPVAIERYNMADITGNYSEMARALGAYAERITAPDEIASAIRRGIAKTKEGVPVLLEFITKQETAFPQP